MEGIARGRTVRCLCARLDLVDDKAAKGVKVKRRVFFIAVAIAGIVGVMSVQSLASQVMSLEQCLKQGIENNLG